MQVYVDGVLNNSVPGPTGTRSAAANDRIGSIQTGVAGGFLNGTIDQVQLFNYVLSATDVAYLYNHSKSQFPGPFVVVGYWKLDETTGPYSLDSSGSNISGLWTNGPAFTTDHPTAIQFTDPGSLSFNGNNQYVNMGTPESLPSGAAPRTICAWAKATSLTGNQFLVSYGTASTNNAMLIGLEGTTLDAGGYNNDLQVPNAVTDNNWHFYALTYDGTTESLYLDGTLVKTAAQTLNLLPSQAFVGELINGTGVNGGNPGSFHGWEISTTFASTTAPCRPRKSPNWRREMRTRKPRRKG
jgi:hypothetical protein